MGTEQLHTLQQSRSLRVGGAIAALGLAVACQSSPETAPSPEASISASPLESPVPASESAPASQPAPDETALNACDSFRSVQPGAYFNRSYASDIQNQLELLYVAFSANSNVDIDRDGKTYVLMLHAMENDPEYADAMHEAMDTAATGPPKQVSLEEFFQYPVIIPHECAPHRVTNADSERQLRKTQDVAVTVGGRLLGHLKDQGSRMASAFEALLRRELNKIQDNS